MKRILFIVLIVLVGAYAYFFFAKKKSNNPSADSPSALAVGRNSGAFNNSVQDVLNQYFQMRDALVNWDSTAISSMSDSLAFCTNAIRFSEWKADTLLVRTAKNYASAIAAECAAMQHETNITEQRKSFYTITENLFDLLRAVHYDRATIYHIICPMAFNGNEEAYWLSDKNEIINPYLGNKDPQYRATMLHCGNVEDSIRF